MLRLPKLVLPNFGEETENRRIALEQTGLLVRMAVPDKRGGDAVTRPRYTGGHQPEPLYWVLERDGVVLHSTSVLDQETAAIHVKHAVGSVVSVGCGSGLFALNAARKPSVKQVVVMHDDEAVVRVVREVVEAELTEDECAKLSWLRGGPMEMDRARLSRTCGLQEEPDTLFVDFPHVAPQLRRVPLLPGRLQEALCARNVGWFGQELDFVVWCGWHSLDRYSAGLDEFDRWCLDNDMVMYERSVDYIRYCFDVYENLAGVARASA